MTDKIKKFLEAFEMMRKYQKAYFAQRLSLDLQKAKQWESVCDRLHAEIVREDKPKAEQGRLI